MGRGRAKAKQTKVARDLKYRPVETDFRSLEQELRGGPATPNSPIEEIPEQYVELVEHYSADDSHLDEDEADDERD